MLAALEADLALVRERFDFWLAKRDGEPATELGTYVVEVSGEGWHKRRGGTHMHKVGSHLFLLRISERGGGMFLAAAPFSEIVAKWQADMAASSKAACESGPSIHPHREFHPPSIWTSGPEFRLVAGPAGGDALIAEFGCQPNEGLTRICMRWQSESLPAHMLPSECQ